MQPENSFDKLSKRLAVTVSRRSLFRFLSLAVAGTFMPSRTALADVKKPTSAELETKFFAGPFIVELGPSDQIPPRCIAAIAFKNSDRFAVGAAYASAKGECPADIASYCENTDLPPETEKKSLFDKSKMFNVRVVENYSRLLKSHPISVTYSFLNAATGKQELEAYCEAFTYLDPRVHQGADRKLIIYKRKPIPEKLTSFDDEVTCGDINYAYENEIKTRKPIALRDFAIDAVPHQASAKRVNATGTSTSNHSGHKNK